MFEKTKINEKETENGAIKKRPGWRLEKIGWIGLLDQIQTLVEGSGTTRKAYNILLLPKSENFQVSWAGVG